MNWIGWLIAVYYCFVIRTLVVMVLVVDQFAPSARAYVPKSQRSRVTRLTDQFSGVLKSWIHKAITTVADTITRSDFMKRKMKTRKKHFHFIQNKNPIYSVGSRVTTRSGTGSPQRSYTRALESLLSTVHPFFCFCFNLPRDRTARPWRQSRNVARRLCRIQREILALSALGGTTAHQAAFDTDSNPIRIDNCASCCISNKVEDFVGPLRTSARC